MKRNLISLLLSAFFTAFLVACEKPLVNGDDVVPEEETDGVHLTLNVSAFEQLSFDDYEATTRAGKSIAEVCTRINCAVFQGDDKVKTVNQTSDDSQFGSIDLWLEAGDYRIVLIAHSGTANATISKPEEVKFPNNKVTDTFCWYKEVTVSSDYAYTAELKRVVAMFRLATKDNVPSTVQQMKFYYTGGSSTLNAVEGVGCVNSRQTELRSVTSDMIGQPGVFDVYTFPHDEEDELKMTVTALGSGDAEVCQKVFEKVPVRRNYITKYNGYFFGEGSEEGEGTGLKVSFDEKWGEVEYSF